MSCSPCRNTARGKQGDPGVSSYVYFGYASDATGANFSLTPAANLKFIQELTLRQPATTLTVADFTGTWVKYIGDDGATGLDGGYGGFTTIFKYRNNTSNSNPGAGNLRLNNTNFTIATELYVSETNYDATLVASFLATAAVSTNSVKSYIRLFNQVDSTAFALFKCSAITDNGTWDTLSLTYIGSSANTPFADQDVLCISITPCGDVGATGPTGVVILSNDMTEVSSTGSGSAENIMSFTVPGNTLATAASKLRIRAVAENRNPNVGSGDLEFFNIRISNNSGAHVAAICSDMFTYNNETVIVDAEVNLVDAGNAFISASGVSANIPLISTYVQSAWDWTKDTVIDMVAQDIISGGSQPEYIVGLQLYVEQITA